MQYSLILSLLFIGAYAYFLQEEVLKSMQFYTDYDLATPVSD